MNVEDAELLIEAVCLGYDPQEVIDETLIESFDGGQESDVGTVRYVERAVLDRLAKKMIIPRSRV